LGAFGFATNRNFNSFDSRGALKPAVHMLIVHMLIRAAIVSIPSQMFWMRMFSLKVC